MISFRQGFCKVKTSYEMFLDKILGKLSALVTPHITVREGEYRKLIKKNKEMK